ncbi:hypothetical protein EDB81DRAFT_771123 [Dactylonectria macrodidyma]|uniref:Aminoglycoside phosphotransferase domain-containing protein n=1 Tax=Dactylonectria macrodidyma TaxID=307937 RepID=A0A9P9JN45_9HYPO|nr:hypothetical protein EDB81DRAFT_771123 [Dactylonectria macrodidyma]
MMANLVVRAKVEREIDQFVESIDTDAVCRIASSYHGGVPCKTFGAPKHGCFNICISVVFDTSPPEKWVVRIALPALDAWIDERIETQLATMKYVSAKTTIPVPRVHGWSFTDDSPIGSAFIIMDYVHGYTLDELGFPFRTDSRPRCFLDLGWAKHKYRQQLADFYTQLRQLEFPKIGALGFPTKNGKPLFDCGADEIEVIHRPMPMEMTTQEFQGMDPAASVPAMTTYSTARSFVEDAVLSLASNDFDKSPDIGLNVRGGRDALYAQHHFHRFVLDNWLDSKQDKGPFVLMHGGLNMLLDKLVFDTELNLVGVLDWEFSCVIPAQMMVPPVWLTGGGPETMLTYKKDYFREVSSIVAAITEREYALDLPPRLSQEWVKMETWCHTAVVLSMVRPDLIYETYWFYLFHEVEGKIPWGVDFRNFYKWAIAPRLVAFMESPEHRALLARKVGEQRQYFADEKEELQMETARCILEERGRARRGN